MKGSAKMNFNRFKRALTSKQLDTIVFVAGTACIVTSVAVIYRSIQELKGIGIGFDETLNAMQKEVDSLSDLFVKMGKKVPAAKSIKPLD